MVLYLIGRDAAETAARRDRPVKHLRRLHDQRQRIRDGVAVDYSEEEATRILSEKEVTAIADVKTGDAEATAWGCDLTYDYVKINADYRS